MSTGKIVIKGAREHNLKNINLEIPRDKLVVITGLSGSGKSSLAFDTIFAEGQRRYVESLSSYARQFLGRLEKPDVDYIEGLSPSISIDQKGISHNPRSTVGTVTEIYDYLRLLFARIGKAHCYKCGRPVESQSLDQMVEKVLSLPKGSKILIMAPLVRGRKGHYKRLFEEYRHKGFLRVRVDGSIYDLDEEIELDKNKKHNIDLIVDRIKIKDGVRPRIAEALEMALKIGDDFARVHVVDGEEILFSGKRACGYCGIFFEDQEPRLFSFNSPYGACPVCMGLGHRLELDPDLVVPDKNKSISEGALAPFGKPLRNFRHQKSESWFWEKFRYFAQFHNIDMNIPFREIPPEKQKMILYGNTNGEKVRFFRGVTFEGVIPNLERRYTQTESEFIRREIEKYMTDLPCPACKGRRLKPQALAVTICGKNIAEVTAMSVVEAKNFFENLELSPREKMIAKQILKEIKSRLSFMMDVGLEYLTLDRASGSLSGGESQRIRLATQIGSSLVGVLYIMDEPTIGLHPRDNQRLLNTLEHLRDMGNTLIVVEHDEETIKRADFIVDIGPEAGVGGGEVVCAGTLEDVKKTERSYTGMYLSGRLKVETPSKRRKPNGNFLTLKGVEHNNLKNIDVSFPLGLFICVTGVSGSGKSSLIDEVLYRALGSKMGLSVEKAGKYREILGWEKIKRLIVIDQSPIGRTPRSNPATYTGVFTPIRQLFASTREARKRGYTPSRFSFNLRGGRCESCQGAGIIKIEMHFLPDVYIPCEVCRGKRFNHETLQVTYKGKNISDILDMTVEEALDFFKNISPIKNKLQTMYDVGLGYIHLGQPATTLSGGEAQRVKLSTELSKRSNGGTLYLLDEPTTGLHFHDVAKLLKVLHRLVDSGNTVIVIEHNLDVIKNADYIIDLGPEGGDKGGEVVATGTPEEIVKCSKSYTGKFLKSVLPIYA